MRSLTKIFVMLLFSLSSLQAMDDQEIQDFSGNGFMASNSSAEPSFHEIIIEQTDEFYNVRQRIIILINSLRLFPNVISGQQYDCINKFLEAQKKLIDDIFDKGNEIQQEQEAASHTSSEQQSELLKILARLSDECNRIVAQTVEQEKSLRDLPCIKPFLEPLNHLARKRYFNALTFITNNRLPKSSIVAFLVGARGYPYQEMPAFLETIACENPQIPITIYSIGCGLDKESAPDILLQYGVAQDSVMLYGQQVDYRNSDPVAEELNQLIINDARPLSEDQKESFVMPPRTYSIPSMPNMKLISCRLQLPLVPYQTGYQFFKNAFANCIRRNLDSGSIVFLGNNTQCFNFEGVPLLQQLYYHFKHEIKHSKADNLQLYTQGSVGQCIVYDPIESPQFPITKFYDHLGKLFAPDRRLGLCCAATPLEQFASGNGLRYHVRQIPGGGLAITHVTSTVWERPEILTTDGNLSRDPNHPEAPWEVK